jgi:hypothetical protein
LGTGALHDEGPKGGGGALSVAEGLLEELEECDDAVEGADDVRLASREGGEAETGEGVLDVAEVFVSKGHVVDEVRRRVAVTGVRLRDDAGPFLLQLERIVENRLDPPQEHLAGRQGRRRDLLTSTYGSSTSASRFSMAKPMPEAKRSEGCNLEASSRQDGEDLLL